MGWVLVDSDGVEATAVVRNPCDFPIEFCSLDFDEQYLEEEKILRMAVGSEYQKSFLMPPCAMGETLPPEVLVDYETEKRTKAQQAELKARTKTKARTEAEAKGKAAPGQKNSEGKVHAFSSCLFPSLVKELLAEGLWHPLPTLVKTATREWSLMAWRPSLEAAWNLLCSVKNCHHIYMVNLHQDYASWKAKEEAERKRKKAEREKEGKKETKIPEKKETKSPEKQETKILEKKTKSPEKKETKITEKKETKAPEKGAPKAPENGDSKAPQKRGTKASGKEETKAPEKGEAEIPEDPAEMENLILRFQIYESETSPNLQVKNKGLKKTSKPQEKVKKPERERVGQRSLQSSQLVMQSEAAEGAVSDKHFGVPCLDIQVSDPKAMIREILRDGKLPTEDQIKPCKAQILSLPWSWALEHCVPQVIMAQSLVQAPDDVPQWLCTICVDGEMLQHLGLCPDGPPLAPAAVLSMVKYPEERLGPAEHVEPFTIVAPEGAAVEDNLAKAPNMKLMNQGALDAPFTCIPSTANVGCCFKFAPEKGIIAPGGIQTIQISFSATVLGRFEEEFQFSVAGSPVPAILTIK
ncbi:Hydrocephalus-inducing [Lonchura striata]|uniref:Hydrocephalus-inducing n=1 Tax=Lonchura striata TaxID=40157 RepID=A0A218UGQ4_9PASE|nr:Hydrocephalus-inducing [Lonchura striata domestica]